MLDVIALGEALIDFTPNGRSSAGNPLFEQNPGGGPTNLLAAASRLGGRCAFLGKVGNDGFGRFLAATFTRLGIDTQGLRFSDEASTTLAFVQLDENGDRSFSFYRNPGADTTLTADELDYALIDTAKIFHFSSLSLTAEPARSATLAAAEYAKKQGCLISYDPNLRPLLWKSLDAAKEGIELGLEYASLLKISHEELEFITGERDLELGTRMLYEAGRKLIVVTLGPGGCFYRCRFGTGRLPTYDTHVVDTTGAGDAFTGAMLVRLSKLGVPLEALDRTALEDLLDYANAAGALCATRRGGVPSMPDSDEVERCRREVPRLMQA